MAANLTRVESRVCEILLACPTASRYTPTVGGNGRYVVTQEITDAILQKDIELCQLVVSVAGHPYTNAFMASTGNLANGAEITPAHVGEIGKVTIDGAQARLATSKSEILEILTNSSLYGLSSKWYFIESAVIYHNGTDAVIRYPNLAISTTPQIHESYESALVAGSVADLTKDGSVTMYYEFYSKQYERAVQMITGKMQVLPELEQYELRAA